LDASVLGIDAHLEDLTVQAAYLYRQANVYPYLTKKGFALKLFQGTQARRCYVAPEAAKPNIVYLSGLGHGLADVLMGHNFEHLFQVGQYRPVEVAGKIVHFQSCRTALQLGQDLVTNGCRAFFGYDILVAYPPEDQDTFFECDSEIDRAFADGSTAQQVYDRVIALYNQRIAERQAAGNWTSAAALETLRDHLCAPSVAARWGSALAKLP
jgi:hypothetical protein